MIDKLRQIHHRYEEIQQRLSDPALINDRAGYRDAMREEKQLAPIDEVYKSYSRLLNDIESTLEMTHMVGDAEFRKLAEEELAELRARREAMEEEIRFLLIPQDPDDSKNCIVEIRAGTGGDEAALFVGDLHRMYQRF